MVGHLYAGTDAATRVLFDPVAAAEALEMMNVIGQEEVETAAASGDLVHWYTAADGSFRLRVYVEEAVPGELDHRARRRVSGRLLRVPSGRLVLAGAEMLLDQEGHWDVDSAAMSLPPGDYVADGFEMDWSEQDDRAFQRAWEAEVGVFGARVVSGLEVLTGLMVMGTLGLAIPAVISLFVNLSRFVEGVVSIGPWFIGAWVLVLVIWRLPVIRRIQEARGRLETERPDAVVVLRHLGTDEERPPRGLAFGEGLD